MKKSNKLIRKRIKVTKGKKQLKVLRRRQGQSHYNANDKGSERRSKRAEVGIGKKAAKKLALMG